MLADLLSPFSYLTIRHPSRMPQLINWVVPCVLSVLIIALTWVCGFRVDVFGANGALSKLLGFLQSLPGFYIAALAAIATFNNRDMLKLMPGVPPTGKVSVNGRVERVAMTRRRFLSSMFAYLTALSISLTLAAIFILAIAEPAAKAFNEHAHQVAWIAVVFSFCVFVAQMVCVTLWGLFYLGDRLHTPDTLPPP